MFDEDLFIAIVNAAYDLSSVNALTVVSLNDADTATPRLVKKAEAAFRLLPHAIPVYDHFTPASWLVRNPQMLDGDSKSTIATLARAEALFEELNKALET